MTSERRTRLFAALALAAGLLAGCADFERGPARPAADGGAVPEAGEGGATPCAALHAVLQPACGGCHAAGEEAGDTGLLFTGDAAADLESVRKFVDTDAPASSRLVAKMAGNGHQGGTVFAAGTPEYLSVLAWIQGGALP